MNEPPQNGAYMVAAYAVGAVILLAYLGSLWVRSRKDGRRGT